MALLLYGLSFLYGASGSMDLGEIRRRLAESPVALTGFGLFARLAMVLIVAGLGFRIAAVPFHFYAPDVFQGTSTANAGLLSVVPKIAGMVALVRLLAAAMPGVQDHAWPVVLVLAAYAGAGGSTGGAWDGAGALLLYLLVYAVRTIGTFAAVACLGRGDDSVVLTGSFSQGDRNDGVKIL